MNSIDGNMVSTSAAYTWVIGVDRELPDGYAPIGRLLADGKLVLFAVERTGIVPKDSWGVPVQSVFVFSKKGDNRYLDWGPVFTRLIASNREKFGRDFTLSDGDLTIIDRVLVEHRKLEVTL